MASAKWKKFTRPAIAHLNVHFGKEEREKNNHANEHIDKSKSHLNKYIGCEDYIDARQKVLDRVDEVDELYPVPKKGRKSEDERIIAGIIITYCPQQIYDEGRSDEFFEKTHAVIMDFFGEKNVGGSMSHYDEIHDYVDAETKEERTSLAHMHTVVAAYAEWKDKDPKTKQSRERRGINGAHFETRSRYPQLNKAIDEMCRREFGVSYLTGEGKGKNSGKSVEQLKAESKLAETEKQIEDLAKKRDEERDLVEQAGRMVFAEQEKNIAKAKSIAVQQLKELVEQIEDKQSELQNLDEQILAAVEIPPRPVMPPEPTMPQPPETQYNFTDKNEMRDYKRAWSEYEKAMKDRPKVLKAYEAECERIAEKQAAWDNQFKPVIAAKNATAKAADKVREAAARERQVQQERQQVQAELERGRAENEKGKCAIQKREQELNLEVERRTQERLEKTDDFQRLMQTSSAWEQRVAELHKSKGSKQQSEKATNEKAKPIASELKGEFSYEI